MAKTPKIMREADVVVKRQRKETTGDHTTNDVIPELTFNNLEIGKKYRVSAQIIFEGTSGTAHGVGVNQSDLNLGLRKGDTTSIDSFIRIFDRDTFIATSTTLTFTGSNLGADRRVGNGSKVVLEEIQNNEETTDFS